MLCFLTFIAATYILINHPTLKKKRKGFNKLLEVPKQYNIQVHDNATQPSNL